MNPDPLLVVAGPDSWLAGVLGTRQPNGTVKATFDAPGEVTDPLLCDCFWHRRVFTHIARGDGGWENAVPLARSVQRIDYPNGGLHWSMEMRIEGCYLRAERAVVPSSGLGPDDPGPVRFIAWATIGKRTVELERTNPQVQNSPAGDPTLIYRMPDGQTRLVIWPEAWWWHLLICSRCDEQHQDPLLGFDDMCGDAFVCGNEHRDTMSLPARSGPTLGRSGWTRMEES